MKEKGEAHALVAGSRRMLLLQLLVAGSCCRLAVRGLLLEADASCCKLALRAASYLQQEASYLQQEASYLQQEASYLQQEASEARTQSRMLRASS